jgi:hypothetical protein
LRHAKTTAAPHEEGPITRILQLSLPATLTITLALTGCENSVKDRSPNGTAIRGHVAATLDVVASLFDSIGTAYRGGEPEPASREE